MSNQLILDTQITNLRLTPRGRLVIRIILIFGVLGALAIVLTVFGFQQPMAPAVAADDQAAGVYQKVVVQPGDTLWEISSRLAQDNDRALILERIMDYNSLETSDLEVGRTLYVPLIEQ